MSMMDFSGVDFTGLANLNIGDLRDSQGRYPMDPGYDPTPATSEGTVYAGGTPNRPNVDGSMPPTDEAPATPALDPYTEFQKQQTELNKARAKDDARVLLAKTLSDYKLDSLTPYVYELIASDKLVNANQDMFVAMIKDRPEYQKRFSANAARVKNKLPELSPGTYIGLENSYKATLRSNGLPDNFYDNPEEDFAKFIEGDIAPSELQERIEKGYNAVANADPEVTRQMESLYGVTKSDLAAYFIDPTRAKPIIENKQIIRQAQAANIAARAVEQGGVNLASDEARTLYEDLANRGFSEGQIMAAFQDVGKLGELKTTFSGETALSQQDIVQGAFGIDTTSAIELEKRRASRVGEFKGGGSFTRTQGETSGAVTTSVGKAQ
jgi:hypothetical protein